MRIGTNDVYDNDEYINDDDKHDIKIDETTYQKMLDAVTNYSLMSTNYNEKLVLIYLIDLFFSARVPATEAQ